MLGAEPGASPRAARCSDSSGRSCSLPFSLSVSLSPSQSPLRSSCVTANLPRAHLALSARGFVPKIPPLGIAPCSHTLPSSPATSEEKGPEPRSIPEFRRSRRRRRMRKSCSPPEPAGVSPGTELWAGVCSWDWGRTTPEEQLLSNPTLSSPAGLSCLIRED